MPDACHIVFGDAGALELRDALRQFGRDDRVLAFPDDLSFGPIAPADPETRAQWVAAELGDSGWHQIVPHVEGFWAAALSASDRHVVWFSRRVTREYAGFLEYLHRSGDRPCDVVDLTETTVSVRGGDGRIGGRRRALSPSLTESYQFIDDNLFSQAVPLDAGKRAAYRAEWTRLCAENAPLRIVTRDLRLASVPLTYFDDALLKQMGSRFLKAARIIGHVLADQWDTGLCDVGDFFLARRLSTLARAGVIESKGDLTHIGSSEVRLPQGR